jgi:hypothetical protein
LVESRNGRSLSYDAGTGQSQHRRRGAVEIPVPGYEGNERRRRQRRIGAGRRVFRDRRFQERRFDVWNSVVADDQRGTPDRRKAKRRLENRRTYPNRRAARIQNDALEIEVAPETPPTV